MSSDAESMPPPSCKMPSSEAAQRTISVPEEATQAYADSLEFSDEEDEGADEATGGSGPLVWGRLVSHGDIANIELKTKIETEGTAEMHCHVIGRSKKEDMAVDAIVDFDQRISSRHCKIFCVREGASENLAVYIENLSGNCTFLRTAANPTAAHIVLDKKDGPSSKRRLNSGDMVSLLLPSKAGSKDVADRATFTFLRVDASIGAAVAGVSSEEVRGGGGLALLDVIDDFYDLERDTELGRGQFGVVFKGVNRETGEVWAIKEQNTKKAELGNSMCVEAMMQECRVLKGLRHPSLCAPEDVFLGPASLFIVIPLCQGGDLFERIAEKNGYSVQTSRELFVRLVEGIAFLHSKGVVHRDLKPENILLSSIASDVDIKIADFGTAKRDAALKTVCGTPQYMAPEVLQGQQLSAQVGKGADMWSLGAIAYVVLSASMPFVESDGGGGGQGKAKNKKRPKMSLYEAICVGAYLPMEGKRWALVSEAAKDFVRRLLVVDPAERMTAEQASDHAFLKPPSLAGGAGEGTAAIADAAAIAAAAAAAATEDSSVHNDGGASDAAPKRQKRSISSAATSPTAQRG